MTKNFILIMAILFIILAGCAPRYMERKPSPRKQSNIVRESQDRLQKIRRENRNVEYSRLLQQIGFYLGTPYKYGGDSRRGMDCSGFVRRMFRESFRLKLPHNAAQLYLNSTRVTSVELETGDLVFFSTNNSGAVNHVGIYLLDNYFAHASESYGVIISKLSERYYRSRYIGGGRILK